MRDINKPQNQLRIYYDEEADFLEIASGIPTKCYAEEVQPGVFIRIDEKTNQVKSIGSLSFKKRTRQVTDIKLNLPLEVNFSPLQQSLKERMV